MCHVLEKYSPLVEVVAFSTIPTQRKPQFEH